MLRQPCHLPATSWQLHCLPRIHTLHKQFSCLRGRNWKATAFVDVCAVVAYTSNLDAGLYEIGQRMDQLVQSQLTDVTPASVGVVLLAGLLTSVSPCTLSVLPLTLGYIGGYAESYEVEHSATTSVGSDSSMQQLTSSNTVQQPTHAIIDTAADEQQQQQQSQKPTVSNKMPSQGTYRSNPSRSSRSKLGLQAACFSLGLASSLAALGVASSLLGRAYGQIGSDLPTAVALVAVVMGLNLLGVIQLQLPSLGVDVRAARLPPPLTAYLAGATFALVASPCSTPVLASLLAYVSTSQNPAAGGLLLLVYSCGYVTPLLVAATATGAVKRVLELRQASSWVTPTSGVLLVAGGTYALLSRLLPAV